MSSSEHGHDAPPLFVGDMRPPAAVLHFVPVILAIFCLTLSLSDYSVYLGFKEGEPGTWMSLFLMFCAFVLAFPAIRNSALGRGRRWLAAALSAMAAYAVLDEKFKWHEALGSYVKKEFADIPRSLRYYADDAVIALLVIAAWLLLALCIRRSTDRRALSAHLWSVLILALLHSVLDVLGHGRQYLWRTLFPTVEHDQVAILQQILGYYEETTKLWCEWFVILFLLRLLYNQRGGLRWSWQLYAGACLAPAGCWVIEDPARGIPYLVMEQTLRYLRNPHFLFMLGALWLVWAVFVWWRFGRQDDRRAVCGLFFVTPFYLLLPEMTQTVGGAAARIQTVTGSLSSALMAVSLAAAAGFALFRWRGPALGVVYLLSGVVGSSLSGLAAQPVRLLEISGLLLPLGLAYLLRHHPRRRLLLAFVIVCALAVHNPIWLLAGFGFVLAQVAAHLDPARTWPSRRRWVLLIALQIITMIVLIWLDTRPFIGCERFRPRETVLFEIGYQ